MLSDESYDMDPNLVGVPNYDVSLDGQQFLMVRSGKGATVPITLDQNWFEELRLMVPKN